MYGKDLDSWVESVIKEVEHEYNRNETLTEDNRYDEFNATDYRYYDNYRETVLTED